MVDYSSVVARLRSFKGMTRERVWREYREREPDGLGYSAFCAGLLAFLQQQKLSARQFHAPGSVIFMDYAGPPLFLTDRRTGLQHPVRVFVATYDTALPCSRGLRREKPPRIGRLGSRWPWSTLGAYRSAWFRHACARDTN